MIEVIKPFFKVSEQRIYEVGEKVTFDKDTDKMLLDNGYAKKVVAKKRSKK